MVIKMKKTPSIFGGACIIASVCVGAGMLGLPTAGAGAWTIWSVAIIGLTMFMMTLSGWLLIDAYRHYDVRVSFNTVTQDLAGHFVNLLNNLAVYFVGGILLYAYTTASGGILTSLTSPYIALGASASKIWSVVFVLVFSSVVWHSTRLVDRLSVLLVIVMLLTFVLSISGLATEVRLDVLFDTQNTQGSYAPYVLGLLPVALTSFGYHHSVSSMRAYYEDEKKAKYAILGGTTIACVFYLLWMLSIFGNLPRADFGPVIKANGDLEVLLNALVGVIDSGRVKVMINAFSIAAILSSFVGVGLGVFDYLADFFQFDNTPKGRTYSWAVTFLPPLVLSVWYPTGFLIAIGYAGAVATIWTCIIPALLSYKAKARYNVPQTGLGYLAMASLLLFGVCTALFHFMAMFNLLPVFQG